ncbi:hypothetical protein Ctob_010804 [Chrysochromulina tobinii]|uniref:N-acetyltransferase domain-containing protein n=1 Tax=Chrysochromulina tobinii TaxID=1460289 RepID=A0A0M0KBP3_9EUKA|nr:hypothetical protein Ctob_010804 [Chrysochromulina tobinii]|eukprot:KOO35982.1 hypothetical protein Ctob_010804 [Chrysochromulina sp. CCMP291]
MPHCPRMPAVSEDDEKELRQVQQEDNEVASDEVNESHYIPSWAKGVVETIKDLKQTQPELLQGAKDVLEERFGHVEWFKALVPGLLGLSKFGKVAINYRPGKSKPLADNQAGDSQHDNLGLALIVQGEEVIAAACTCIVRANSRSKSIALEVLLFAVKASYEKQGVATRLVSEIFRHCRARVIPEVMILSDKRIEQPRNWWVLKGGFELQVGNAQKLIHFKMMQVPVDHGGIGATQVELTYCKFGMEYEKPTFFWTNIESLIKELENGEKICSEETPCKSHVEKACSKRRNDSVPA